MELPEIIKKHHELIDVMIDMNQLLRSQNRVKLAGENEISYAVQFCTIRCNIFRGIGKSQYIIDNATKNDLIVVRDESMKKLFRSRFDCDIDIHQFDILTAGKINLMQGKAGREYDRIYVDEPNLCFDSRQLIEFYMRFASGDSNQTFILLGL